MEGCLCEVLSKFSTYSRIQIRDTLYSESRQLEITKSILNVLHNIVVVKSIEVTRTQKDYFDKKEQLVWELLSTKSLKSKKTILESNPDLVACIAYSCPKAASG